jgi:hypothetical protein
MCKYQILTPSGVIADGEWSSPTEIPERIPDRWDIYFDTRDSVVVITDDSGTVTKKNFWDL